MTSAGSWTIRLAMTLALCAFLATGCKKAPKEPAKKAAKVAAAEPTPEPDAEAAKDAGDAGDAGESADTAPPQPAKAKAHPPPEDTPADVAKAPADAEKSRSGLAWKRLYPGTGKDHPARDDTVFIHHATWTTEGKRVANTWRKRRPKILKVSKLLPGWRAGLEKMVVGERFRLWIPEKMALARSQRRKGKKGMRVVDIELLRLKIAPPAPADVRRPPKDAQKTKTGLAWKSLSAGKGERHPKATSEVTVRYAGWTTKGHCFDHTDHDETMTFPLNGVIEGWTEGLQLLVEGEKARFWLPKKLAYDGARGKPKGMLVFDIELLKITP